MPIQCAGLDLPFEYDILQKRLKEQVNPFFSSGDVVLLSGCQDDGTSIDATTSSYSSCASGGAMTTALVATLQSNPCPTFGGDACVSDVYGFSSYFVNVNSLIESIELISELQNHMRVSGYNQVPHLSASQDFDVCKRPFLLDDCISNSNTVRGRIVRRKFPPRRRPIKDTRLLNMLSTGAMIGGGALMLGMLLG